MIRLTRSAELTWTELAAERALLDDGAVYVLPGGTDLGVTATSGSQPAGGTSSAVS